MPSKRYIWEFPLPRTHCGILHGNGTFGAIVWGDEKLCVTFNRADFWDHRGGMPFTEEMTYKNIRECLETNDEQRLRKLFEGQPTKPGEPRRPSILPLGRLEMTLPTGANITHGELDTQIGETTIYVERYGNTYKIVCFMMMDVPCFYMLFDKEIVPVSIERVTSWNYVGEYLSSIGFQAPVLFDEHDISGWTQMRPADPTICFAYRIDGQELIATAVYGDDETLAKNSAKATIYRTVHDGTSSNRKESRRWWKSYWKDVPSVRLPSKQLEFIYYYGMYKFAGLTNPTGVPATLQGPWVEEYQMPPWSSDYHFNINVQECYWPTFAGNRLEHIKPLFNMIKSWEDKLRHNAKMFLGIDDGLMLPHAVDDRCTCMGGFWTGTIDHGSTAWVAHLMWLYYKYSMDIDFLRETAYPFMKGVMRVYEEMLERVGDSFVLPVSVSPEYKGASMDAWGKNASFQLYLIHFLCRALCEASRLLGIDEGINKWQEIDQKLPEFSVINNRIALWEGQDLEHSHRHHSHLAGIYPFDTLEYEVEGKHYQIVQNTILHWIRMGMGEWSGWCMPWASIIHSRLKNAHVAKAILELWDEFFTNEGHGTLHDVQYPGISIMGIGRKGGELMQIEAGMGAVTAVQEMLMHTSKGIIRLFNGIPSSWKNVSFKDMRAEGAFLVSAKLKDGKIKKVKVFSERGCQLKIENNISRAVRISWKGKDREEVISDRIIDVSTEIGDIIIITPEPIMTEQLKQSEV